MKKTLYLKILCFFMFFIAISVSPLLSRVIQINENLTEMPIGLYLDYLEDKDGSLTLSSVQSKEYEKNWIASKDKNPSFGFTKSVYWARFTIENTLPEEIEIYLQQSYPLIDNLTLYIPENNNYITIETGDLKPFKIRPFVHRTFIIPIKIKARSSAVYYLRQKTSSSMKFILNVWSPSFFQEDSMMEYHFLMLFYGIIFVMVIYNFFVFISVRRIEYLYYIGALIFLLIFIMIQNGTAFQFFWPDSPWFCNFFNPLSLCILLCVCPLFLIKTLNLKEFNLFLYKEFSIVLIINFVVFILCLFLPYGAAMIASAVMAGITLSNALLISLIMTIKKQRHAYIFTAATSSFIIGAALYIGRAFGLFPDNFFTEWSLQVGLTFMVILFSLALADRINIMRKELKILNIGLEQKVRNRTEELNAAMEELEAVNDSLVDTNSDLEKKTGDLEEAAVVMDAMNDNLKEALQELEDAHKIAQKDMAMAANVQMTLLPKQPPQPEEWDSAFAFKPCSGVSGDLYDFYEKDKHLIGLSLMDVSGHGIASGLLTMIARSVFTKNFNEGINLKLSQVVEEANRNLIHEIGKVDNYLTGIILRFKDNSVEYVNAGHSDLLHKNSKSGKVTEVNKDDNDFKGILLGLDGMEKPYSEFNFSVAKEDILLLYTDCLYESKNNKNEEYDNDRIIRAFEKAPNESAQCILDNILDDFYSFVGEKPLKDDLTVIVLKRKI